jgi:hypothetical protein
MPQFDITYAMNLKRSIEAPDMAAAQKEAKRLIATNTHSKLISVTHVNYVEKTETEVAPLKKKETSPWLSIDADLECQCTACKARRGE